jgi:WD40 repeat protein
MRRDKAAMIHTTLTKRNTGKGKDMKRIAYIAVLAAICFLAGAEGKIGFTALGRTATCSKDLRLRSAQSALSDTIAIMKAGTRIAILGIGTPFSADGIESSWCGVLTEDGKRGWCFGGYLELGEWAFGEVELRRLWKNADGSNIWLSPDGRFAATIDPRGGGGKAGVRLRDAETGNALFSELYDAPAKGLDGFALFSGSENALVFSKDGTLRSMDLRDGSAKIWETPLGEIKALAGGVGKPVIAAKKNGQGAFLYDPAASQWKRITEYSYHSSYCAVCQDDKRLAVSWQNGGEVALYDLETAQMAWTLDDGGGYPVFSDDGASLFCVSDFITEIDVASGKIKRRAYLGMAAKPRISGIAYSPDQAIIAICAGSRSVRLFSLASWSVMRVLELPDIASVASMDRAGTKLATNGGVYSLSFSGKRGPGPFDANKGLVADDPDGYLRFICENDFASGEFVPTEFIYAKNLSFRPDGVYSLSYFSNRDYPEQEVKGAFEIKGKTVKLYPVARTENNGKACDFFAKDLALLRLDPRSEGATFSIDPEYADFDFQGALRGGKGRSDLRTAKESPAGKVYSYAGIECVKLPGDGTIEESRFVSPKKNATMRSAPSISSAPVHLPWSMDDDIEIKDRTVVFKDEIYQARARTVKKDAIGGVTAPWYLITVVDVDAPYAKSARVWVFGGDMAEFGKNDYEDYRANRDENLAGNIRASGLLKSQGK